MGVFLFAAFFIFRGNYLLFVTRDLSMIPIMMIIILIVFVFSEIKERFFNGQKNQKPIMDESDEPLEIEKHNKFEKFLLRLVNVFFTHDIRAIKIIKVVKIIYILVLIIVIYLGMTSYGVLYSESIKIGSPTVPKGVVYKYRDVKNVNVGISKNSKKSYSPYYNVIFNDGKSVDFFGAAMHESKDLRFEDILIDLDEKLITQGVVKNVDKEDFEKYSEGLDMNFVSRVERLFDDQ